MRKLFIILLILVCSVSMAQTLTEVSDLTANSAYSDSSMIVAQVYSGGKFVWRKMYFIDLKTIMQDSTYDVVVANDTLKVGVATIVLPDSANFNNYLIIDKSGNVGIGTSTSDSTLAVAGGVSVTGGLKVSGSLVLTAGLSSTPVKGFIYFLCDDSADPDSIAMYNGSNWKYFISEDDDFVITQ